MRCFFAIDTGLAELVLLNIILKKRTHSMHTKADIITLYNGLNGVGNLSGVTFSYSVHKNLALMKNEIDSLQKAITPSKEWMEYDQKRVEIVKKYALKDDKGEYIVKNGAYDVNGNELIVETEVAPLKGQYRDVITKREEQIAQYNELLGQASDVKLYTVKLEDVPKDITADQMKGIYLIIEAA